MRGINMQSRFCRCYLISLAGCCAAAGSRREEMAKTGDIEIWRRKLYELLYHIEKIYPLNYALDSGLLFSHVD